MKEHSESECLVWADERLCYWSSHLVEGRTRMYVETIENSTVHQIPKGSMFQHDGAPNITRIKWLPS